MSSKKIKIQDILKEKLQENGVSSYANIAKEQAEHINEVLSQMNEGDEISFGNGYIKIVATEQSARVARNPKTGESIDVPAKTVLKMKVGSKLKDALNS